MCTRTWLRHDLGSSRRSCSLDTMKNTEKHNKIFEFWYTGGRKETLTVALKLCKVVLPGSIACLPEFSSMLIPLVLTRLCLLKVDAGIVGEAFPHLLWQTSIWVWGHAAFLKFAKELLSVSFRAILERFLHENLPKVNWTVKIFVCRVEHRAHYSLDFWVSHFFIVKLVNFFFIV